MKLFPIIDHEPSLLPEGDWSLIWADEFDGDALDRSKWDFRLNFWGSPFPAYTDKGVLVRNGCVELHRTERDGYYVSPQLQTGTNSFDLPIGDKASPFDQTVARLGQYQPAKFEHRYGYYEVRCKFPKEPDVMWSAFWLQSASIGTRYDPAWSGIENDIVENFAPNQGSTGNILYGNGVPFLDDGRVTYSLQETEDGFHRFGMLWTEDEYVFYCDGAEISRCNHGISRVPQFLLLTTEVRGYRKNKPLKVGECATDYSGTGVGIAVKRQDGFTDDAFIVDYVRVFDLQK